MTHSETPFLELPPELHLLIAEDLFFIDKLHLQSTCTSLYNIIPPPTHDELLEAEGSAYATKRNLYTCRYCVRLLPACKFADRMLRKRRNRHGPDAGKRFCIECGLKPREDGPARYGPGALVSIQGTLHVICLTCKQLKKGFSALEIRRNPTCESCWIEERERQRHRERQRERDALRSHATKYAVYDVDM